jgi:hypothetical protein
MRLNSAATARTQATSFVRSSTDADTTTFLGAPAHTREPKGQLYLLGTSLLAGEDTHGESGRDRLDRYIQLVRTLTISDPGWTGGFLRHLRRDRLIRTAAIIGAAEFVAVRRENNIVGTTDTYNGHSLARRVVASVLHRPDEVDELLAYWFATYGRALPKAIRNGANDAMREMWDERALLKYDKPERPWRFADALALAHPTPRSPAQSAVWLHALQRRHGHAKQLPPGLPVIRYRRELMKIPACDADGVNQRREWLLRAAADGDVAAKLRAAGMTWEALAGWLQGPMDAVAWEAVATSCMGVHALLRNLRNFDQARVSDEAAADIGRKISNPADIAEARVMPFRFYSAYQANAASLRWSWPLEQGLNRCLGNVPRLGGRSLVLVDRSPSMWDEKLSKHSTISWADGAAVFGTVLALRAEHADLIEFGDTSRPVPFGPTDSVLPVVSRFGQISGTNIPAAIRQHFRPDFHDRVIIVTDEQTRAGHVPYFEIERSPYYSARWVRRHTPIDELVPHSVPVYIWNLAGYEPGFAPTGDSNRHCFGGLSGDSFEAIERIEAGDGVAWPFPPMAA